MLLRGRRRARGARGRLRLEELELQRHHHDARAQAATRPSAQELRQRLPGEGRHYRSAGSSRSASRTTSTRPASTSATRGGSTSNLLLRSLVGLQAPARRSRQRADRRSRRPQCPSRPTAASRTRTSCVTGIKFGPPVNRAVTSKDVAYAMNRLANPKDGGQYSFYYTVIKGWDDVADGKAKTVSGITTPDDKTIVFHLTKPTGDFNLRMSMPATAPIPKEVGDCFEGKPGDYGRERHLERPVHDPGLDRHVLVVLRPSSRSAATTARTATTSSSSATRTTTSRPTSTGRTIRTSSSTCVNSNADDIYAKVQAGKLEDEQSSPQPKTIRQYVDGSDPEAAAAPERRRPHLVPDDEPDAAAVRRHPRPQGDEPDHRQERRCARRGAVPWSARSRRTSRRR